LALDTQSMRYEPEAGTVTYEDGIIEFRRGNDHWRLRLDSVSLIGEFTDASWGDDYCLSFVQRGTGAWYVLPYGTKGCRMVIDAIGRDLGATLTTGLANSTVFRSRILWPDHLRDKPFLSEVLTDGILGWLGLRVTKTLLPEIVAWSKREAD
jgi:hypothetical protein